MAFARRLRAWRQAAARGEMSPVELARRVQGWVAHAAHGDTWGLRRALLCDRTTLGLAVEPGVTWNVERRGLGSRPLMAAGR